MKAANWHTMPPSIPGGLVLSAVIDMVVEMRGASALRDFNATVHS
jgi:hypothetical protein